MSVLADAFNRSDAHRSFLSRVFSSPLVRGRYADEKPEIEFALTGSKTEQKRQAHLINTIARHSPTGKKILQAAAKDGYSIGFETMSNSCGSCNKENKKILLNPMMNDAKLTTTLAHESRHAQQNLHGVNSRFCTYDVATELRLRRATEADAQAAALQTALEIRAATHDGSVFYDFKSSYPEIVAELPLFSREKPLKEVVADRDKNMTIAFCGWFDQNEIVSAYEAGYLRGHLKSIAGKDEAGQMHVFAERPFHGHMTSEDIVGLVCQTENGECYLARDPHVLNRPKMCGIAPETKAAADMFFSRRQQLTDKAKDISYRELPERVSRSFASECGHFGPGDIKKTPLINAVLNKRSR